MDLCGPRETIDLFPLGSAASIVRDAREDGLPSPMQLFLFLPLQQLLLLEEALPMLGSDLFVKFPLGLQPSLSLPMRLLLPPLRLDALPQRHLLGQVRQVLRAESLGA